MNGQKPAMNTGRTSHFPPSDSAAAVPMKGARLHIKYVTRFGLDRPRSVSRI